MRQDGILDGTWIRALALASVAAAGLWLAGCKAGGGQVLRVASDDGVAVLVDPAGRVVVAQVDDRALPSARKQRGGFYVRAANGDEADRTWLTGSARTDEPGVVTVEGAGGGLSLSAKLRPGPDFILVEGQVRNGADGERSAVVGFNIPLELVGWSFAGSLTDSETMSPGGRYTAWTSADTDWDGRQVNRGLFTPIIRDPGTAPGVALAMGIEPDQPQVFRVGCTPANGFWIEFDLGLGATASRFSQSAPVRFILFRFEPTWGYRSALARYYQMFEPLYRSPPLGGKLAVPAASAADYIDVPIASVQPTDPAPSAEAISRDLALWWSTGGTGATSKLQFEAARNSHLTGPDGRIRTWTVFCPQADKAPAAGKPTARMVHRTPTDPDPELPTPNQASCIAAARADSGDVRLAGYCDFDGRYVDNYRPAHLAMVDYPLAFNYRTGRPVQAGLTRPLELARPLANALRQQGRRLWATASPWRASLLPDVAWLDGAALGECVPRGRDGLAYLRTLMGQKPIVQADAPYYPGPANVVAAQRRLDAHWLAALGIVPEAAGKDANVAACRQAALLLADAGWRPVTHAIVSHPAVLVERFGQLDADRVYFTVHNTTADRIDYRLTVDSKPLRLNVREVGVREVVSGAPLSGRLSAAGLIDLVGHLAGGETNVIELSRSADRPAQWVDRLPTTAPPQAMPAAAGEPPVYDGAKAPYLRRDLMLGEASWRKFAECYEAEKRFVAANVQRLFASLAADEPVWTTDNDAFQRTMRLLVDFSVRAYRPQFASALNGPQFVRFCASRNYPDLTAAGLRHAADWRYQFRARLPDRNRPGALELVVWDPNLETSHRMQLP